MAMLTDLADALRDAGLDVVELDGWKDRGQDDGPFEPIGLMLHHDAMALGFNDNPHDDMNVPRYMSRNGNLGSQLWVSRYGVWVCLAAGRKWHAGDGGPIGDIRRDAGNTQTIGIETDHTDGTPWTAAMMHAIYTGCRALVDHYGYDPRNCVGHKEYAPKRKHDPSGFDLDAWRKAIGEPVTPSITKSGLTVDRAQRLLNRTGVCDLDVNGQYDAATIRAVERFQQSNGLAANGTLDDATWEILKNFSTKYGWEPPSARDQALARLHELQQSAGISDAAQRHLETAYQNVAKATSDPALKEALARYRELLGKVDLSPEAFQHLRTAAKNVEKASKK